MPYNRKLTDDTDLNRSGSTGKYPTSVLLHVLTSLSLGQYSKTSVGYFPVLPSLSVSKLLVLRTGICTTFGQNVVHFPVRNTI
jgi:hypothetical protein